MFEEYKAKLAGVVGEEKMEATIAEALYIISTGSNDYILNYFVSPSLHHRYSTEQFSTLVMTAQTHFIHVCVLSLAPEALLNYPRFLGFSISSRTVR